MKDFFKYTAATLLGLVLFMFIGTYLFLMLLGSFATIGSSKSSEATAVAKPHSVYKLTLKGSLSERVSDDAKLSSALSEAMGQSVANTIGLNDILSNIRKAKNDDNIEGIYLRCESFSAGYASRQEIRKALQDFKTSGKFLVAYADEYSQANYYLASVADKICMNAQGALDWRGLYSSYSFYKRLADKIGVEMQVIKVGTFKSAVEPYMLTAMSEANKEQTRVMLGDIWGEMTHAVSQSRHISVAELNDLADRNLVFEAPEVALEAGLVDTLLYIEDMEQVLTDLCHTDNYKLLSHSNMCNLKDTKDQKSSKAQKVAMLYAVGEISDSGNSGIVGDDMVETIDDLADDDDIKAVVFRVNSPGGSAFASEKIWYALSRLKEKKPVVVSMGDYAASGGYYISCNANYIYAQPNTLTGSIGIFGLIPNMHGLLDKVGIDNDGVATNKNSGIEQTMTIEGMTAEQRLQMQTMINRGYELFTKRCADGREMSQDAIKEIAEGRVWSGMRAVELGLVDSIGTIQDAISKAAALAEIEDYQLVDYPEEDDMFKKLMKALDLEARIESIAERHLGKAYKVARDMEQMSAEPSIQALMIPIEIQ